MEEKRTSVLSNGMIWFGAAVSIAEILTGTYLAPLGFAKGMAAMILGHVIGCVLLYLAGLIGGQTRKSAMETVKLSFGEKGSLLFSVLNVLQLVGWTGIMIVSGARAASVIAGGMNMWSVVIGALIIVWLVVGIRNIDKLNKIAMTALFLLTVVLSFVIFRGGITAGVDTGEMSFGAAVELGVAMPLSWLPLISDYTREAEKPGKATLASAAVYFFASCWMYAIGLGAAIFTGESDIASILLQAGLGIVGVLIVVVSTVSTTFLDAYSAGVSAGSISAKFNEKITGIVVSVIGILLALFTPIENMENFLYLIGSVFAPMIAIQIADYFIWKRRENDSRFDWCNLVIWAAGFVLYRVFMQIDTPVGNTLPTMVIVIAVCLAVGAVRRKKTA